MYYRIGESHENTGNDNRECNLSRERAMTAFREFENACSRANDGKIIGVRARGREVLLTYAYYRHAHTTQDFGGQVVNTLQCENENSINSGSNSLLFSKLHFSTNISSHCETNASPAESTSPTTNNGH